jgi:eukaryotic-like serine/threonine-protein kinase
MTADGHLLFGLLALQTGLIRQEQLVAAFHAWTCDKARPLADHLIALGHLNAAQRSAVEALAALHVESHGGDAIRSLTLVPAGKSTRDRLAALGDPDIESTLDQVSSGPAWSEDEDANRTPVAPPRTRSMARPAWSEDSDADRTGHYAVGTAASESQRFRILRPHATGGLGAVFVALDCELNREVALKQILEHHADDPTSRQRFLIEAEVTGGLEHPGIVPVYGLGTYPDGRPYYAMRFIKGDSLKVAVERFHADASLAKDPGRRSLELRKLLRRFLDVCNAIDYAHSRGVLHRDIKPGNIIVGEHGETLVVDWGLAKVTGQSDPASGERTLVRSSASGSAETLPGSALGTPAFMSPEQAGGDLEALGPRSDVYNLGATLYGLLTGRPPFTGDHREVLRAVQRGDVRPPRAIDPSIDPALEAVCLKAMAFRPDDRYGAARALAEDIERWMADEPVSAWPEPIGRRARRWMQRNRTAVAMAGVALLAGVIGLGAVTGVQARANGDLRRAKSATEAALAQSEDNARRAESNAETARREAQRADDNAGLINDRLGRLVERVQKDRRLQLAGLTAFREGLLRDVIGMYEELASRNGEGTLGLGQALNSRARVQYVLGEFPQALASQLRGEEVLTALPPTYEVRRALGDARRQLGVLYHFSDKPAEGLPKARDAVSLFQALILERPGDQDARFHLALATVNVGNYAMDSDPNAAIARYREALELIAALRGESPDNPRYTEWEARTTSNLGLILAGTGKTEAAVVAQRQAVALAEQVADDFFRFDALATCRNNLAEALEQARRPAEAETVLRLSLRDYQGLATRFPNDVDYRWGVAMASSNLAAVVLRQDRPREARELIEEAGKIYDELKTALGNNPDFRQYYARYTSTRDAIRKSPDARSR